MDGERDIYEGEGVYRRGFGAAGDHLKDLHVDGGLIFERILKKQGRIS
jgi:hypothetical protein